MEDKLTAITIVVAVLGGISASLLCFACGILQEIRDLLQGKDNEEFGGE